MPQNNDLDKKRLTKQGKYGIIFLQEAVEHDNGSPTTKKTVAEKEQIP